MKHTFFLLILSTHLISGCSQNSKQFAENNTGTKEKSSFCDDDCMAKSASGKMECKLTSAELQQRRETVIASLKKQVVEKKELENGYAFKFPGNDKMIDELTEFIKTERSCCDFFTFNLSISGDQSEAWLELSGQEGVKDFISAELGL